ncbi:hypothetical protein [Desulfosediminicola flagellatus]|uniref:hypothetical protein n=1 Tax=Desulfosediminicola flagellatus TaxID=2569541 RepID=UPI0010ACAB02|nr:hypothetical protein [Desulfosediminicola flagellatus]
MEIIIGSMPPLAPQPEKPLEKNSPLIEGQLLHVRKPRKGIAGPSGMERRGKKVRDPLKGRVLTIMVPDGNLLPSDIDSANYSVQVRFVRK